MNNQLITVKESFFTKIRKYFLKLFSKDKKEEKDFSNVENIALNNKQSEEKNFKESVKVDEKDLKTDIKDWNLEQFIDNLQNHPELIENLSTDRLLQLQSYINKELDKYNEKIQQLKNIS